ncbi:MAG: hypothetical protein JW973_06940 [Bacteroidales bacterium]|nr:hypothetical protein [Bacteroidales bacterium]
MAVKGFPPCNEYKRSATVVRCINLLFAGLLMLSGNVIRGQEADADTLYMLARHFNDVLQPDQHLIHGTRYYNLYPNAPGHPFMEPDEFRTGSIVINDKQYKPVSLKYDICNQRVLMRYPLNIGGTSDIVLINDAISGFEMDGKVFCKYPLPKKGYQYCQEIGTESLKCLFYWHKELVPLNNSLESYNQYTDQKRDYYLYRNTKLVPFKGKKSFLHCFPVTMQHAIRDYIKDNRIVFRYLSDTGWKNLIQFCGDRMDGNQTELQEKQ